jgi:long-subunit fatty acid transport protein
MKGLIIENATLSAEAKRPGVFFGAKSTVLRLAMAIAFLQIAALASPALARNAPEVFARGFGSKASAMGNSFVSIADDASAVFWNPAGTGWIPRKTFTFSLTDIYFADVDYSSVSYVQPAGTAGAFGFSLTRWSVDGIEKRDENNILLRSDLGDTQMEFITSYSTPPLRDLTAAVGLKVDTQAMDDETAFGMGLDLGVLYRPGSTGLRGRRAFSAGIAVRNLVEPVLRLSSDRTSFPTQAVFSTSYGGRGNRFFDGWTVAIDLNAPSDLPRSANVGFEASVRPVSFRTGSLDGRFTAGIGTAWEGLSFDYAYTNEDYGRLHTFSLSVSFGDPAPNLASRSETPEEKLAVQ